MVVPVSKHFRINYVADVGEDRTGKLHNFNRRSSICILQLFPHQTGDDINLDAESFIHFADLSTRYALPIRYYGYASAGCFFCWNLWLLEVTRKYPNTRISRRFS